VRGNPQALFGKRPTEKDPAKGTSPAVHFTLWEPRGEIPLGHPTTLVRKSTVTWAFWTTGGAVVMFSMVLPGARQRSSVTRSHKESQGVTWVACHRHDFGYRNYKAVL
jgi:hypothetical protein